MCFLISLDIFTIYTMLLGDGKFQAAPVRCSSVCVFIPCCLCMQTPTGMAKPSQARVYAHPQCSPSTSRHSVSIQAVTWACLSSFADLPSACAESLEKSFLSLLVFKAFSHDCTFFFFSDSMKTLHIILNFIVGSKW